MNCLSAWSARAFGLFLFVIRHSILLTCLSTSPLHAHGDVHEQIEELGVKLQANPADHSSRMSRASCYFVHGQYAETLDDLDKLSSEVAAQKGPSLLRLRACLKVFRLKEADKLAEDFLRANPGDLDVLEQRAALRLAQQKPREAIADFDTIIAATPSPNPDLLLNRARATACLDTSQALAWIDERMKTSPLYVLEEEAITLCQNSKRAKEAADRLLKMSLALPRPEFCHARRARLLEGEGLHKEALLAWKDCLAALDKLPAHTRTQPAVAELRKAAETSLSLTP